MSEKTVAIPFKILTKTENGVPTAYSLDDELSEIARGNTEARAAAKLRGQIQSTVKRALRAQTFDNTRSLAIYTTEGSLFVVAYRHDSWQYSIAGPGRTHSSGCVGMASYEEAVQKARAHAADDVFGPILWECSLL